ncbi:hypothetical protein HXX76_008577 [Chlamydomonas incerta]|uniref:Uncharacterized protein n=1 Tax=Chlamydomonas incerta TaxID=51695 RepID=A0A835T2W4_CHLIN|nr:hypothetical protein HXX76_008577 [Chlamydomonas incerta]|eukprot:KAG2432844.1 hypothetical protein HXX76_008577 [Chlamydomonas incerta]
MVGLPAGEREAKAPNSMSQDEYKEWLRAAGRRTLDKYRHQKGLAAKSTGAGAAPAAPAPPPAVELTTFKVFTQPAAAQTGRATLPPEMPRLGQGMASTSLGALPPSSACAPSLHKTSCSSSAASGTVVAGSLPSSTAYSLAASSYAGTSPAPEGFLLGRQEDEGPSGLDLSPGMRAASSGVDQAMADMLLAQVETLMRDKAALSAENAALRQQVEQLTELVGWLSLERGEEGAGGAGLVEEEGALGAAGLESPGGALYGYDSAYAFADPSDEPGQDPDLAGPGPSAESVVAAAVACGASEGMTPGLTPPQAAAAGPGPGDTVEHAVDATEAGPLGPLG